MLVKIIKLEALWALAIRGLNKNVVQYLKHSLVFCLCLGTKENAGSLSLSLFVLGWDVHSPGLLPVGHVRMPFGEEGEITLCNFPATLVDSVKEEKMLCIPQDLCLMQRP